MPVDSYEVGSSTYNGESFNDGRNSKQNGGMYVSTAKAFILTFLAIAIAVGVGVIVHFAGPVRDVKCTCTFPTTDSGNGDGTSAAMEQCKDWARKGNTAICNVCPTKPPTTATPMVTTDEPDVTLPTSPQPEIDIRLPLNLDPILYTVELQPHMYTGDESEFFFNGSLNILFHCKSATTSITLHTNKLNYTGEFTVFQEGRIGTGLNIYTSHVFNTERQFLVIMTTGLISGRNYTVNIPSFHGALVDDMAGLYLSHYTRNNETIYIASSQMQIAGARKAFPCMDEPAIKSHYDVTLVRKSHMLSISNMPIKESTDRGDNWVADHFETSPRMSTYLLAFIVCDFNYTQQTTAKGVQYRIWSRPEAISQTSYAMDVGMEVLDLFEDYFNVPFPLPKQDLIAIPDFGLGAMENWGLVTLEEKSLLYEPEVSSEGDRQTVAIYVAHELAHQWFGNLVTPSWWGDLWLNEGFCSFMMYLGVDEIYPEWKLFEQHVIFDLHEVFKTDSLMTSRPAYVPVSHPDDAYELFDSITYQKGAFIIRMLRFFLGHNTFQNGLTTYLRQLAYGAAFHDDLWWALGNQSVIDGTNIDVKGIMDTWTLQMNYPVVMVKHTSQGSITIEQQRYLQSHDATDPGIYESPFNYTWDIPFAFTTSSDRKFNVDNTDVTWLYMDQPPMSVTTASTGVNIPAPGEGAWVLGNPMQYGYYRVNYEGHNWIQLINQLVDNHEVIHPINRAQIVNDAWSLARSGDLHMSTALNTINYLVKEEDYIPRHAANIELDYLSTMLVRHPLFGSFSKFMRHTTQPLFTKLTMNNTGAAHLESFLRSDTTKQACSYDIQECIDESKRLFREWMTNPANNPIEPDVKDTVYCQGVEHGGQEEWEFVLQQYTDTNVGTERYRLLQAMACSKQTWLLSRYIQMAIDADTIRRDDTVAVIIKISKNVIGRSVAWDSFLENWDFLKNEFGTWWLQYLVRGITATFNTEFHYSQIEAFVSDNPDLGSAARAFEQAKENTRSNINWMSLNVPIIEDWLKSQGF